MKSLLAVALTGLLVCGTAYATDQTQTPTNSQQTKMATCQAQATEKKLESKARQEYVNNCLKAKPAKAKSKMAMCNEKTKGMTKAERTRPVANA